MWLHQPKVYNNLKCTSQNSFNAKYYKTKKNDYIFDDPKVDKDFAGSFL